MLIVRHQSQMSPVPTKGASESILLGRILGQLVELSNLQLPVFPDRLKPACYIAEYSEVLQKETELRAKQKSKFDSPTTKPKTLFFCFRGMIDICVDHVRVESGSHLLTHLTH